MPVIGVEPEKMEIVSLIANLIEENMHRHLKLEVVFSLRPSQFEYIIISLFYQIQNNKNHRMHGQ